MEGSRLLIVLLVVVVAECFVPNPGFPGPPPPGVPFPGVPFPDSPFLPPPPPPGERFPAPPGTQVPGAVDREAELEAHRRGKLEMRSHLQKEFAKGYREMQNMMNSPFVKYLHKLEVAMDKLDKFLKSEENPHKVDDDFHRDWDKLGQVIP